VEEYNKLATHLLTENGYAPLTLQEKADIVKAFGFCESLCYLEAVTRFNPITAPVGHFYNCPNGHASMMSS